MTNHWKLVPLGEIVQFLDNKRVPLSEAERRTKKGEYPYYGANGQVDSIDEFIFDEPLVLLAEDGGHFGSKEKPIAYKIIGKSWVNNHAHVLRPNSDCHIDYLHRVLSFYDVAKYVTGSTRLKLRKADCQKFIIPLPPLDEQNRIAAILERLDTLRQKRKQADALTATFLQSVFLEMFGDPVRNPKGWEVKKFSAVATIERDSIDSLAIDGDANYIGLEHIEKETGNLLSYQKAAIADLKSNKHRFSKEHILYGKLRPYLNKVCLPNINGVCSTDIIPIRPKQGLTNRYYIAYFMKHPSFVDKANAKSAGANLPRISPKILDEFDIPLPPLSIQEQFAAVVEKVEAMRSKQLQSAGEIERLFQSSMQLAFRGEL